MELIPDVFFCLQVDGPITGGGGLVSGWAYKWQLTVFMYLSVSLEAVKPLMKPLMMPVTRALKKKLLLGLYVLVFKSWSRQE